MREMGDRQQRLAVLGMAVVGLALVGALGWGVWRQVRRLHELEAAEAELMPLVAHERERNEQLRQELEHVLSPDYTEEWARVHAGMTLPGEVRLALPLPEESDEPASPPPAQPSLPFWQRLRQRLFGSD